MKTIFYIILFGVTINLFGQSKKPEDFGYRHMQTVFKTDTVDILIKSKKGDEQKIKPLLLFCQGSLPQPLIKYDEQGVFGVFPFNTDSLVRNYHIAIISKPYVPLISNVKFLGQNYTYKDSTGAYPLKYSERNLLDYYVQRNLEVIKFLQKQNWISKQKLVVVGHSEGSTIAVKLAEVCAQITHLIYSSGNPCGRILSIVEEARAKETDSLKYGEENFNYWENVVANSEDMDMSKGDTYKATYGFSSSLIDSFDKLKIPVLICYGTKDFSSPFNDLLRVEMIRKKKSNFKFFAYIGTEHNYFPVLPNGKKNFDIYNWDKVAMDWDKWLREK